MIERRLWMDEDADVKRIPFNSEPESWARIRYQVWKDWKEHVWPIAKEVTICSAAGRWRIYLRDLVEDGTITDGMKEAWWDRMDWDEKAWKVGTRKEGRDG